MASSRKKLFIDFSGFADYAERLENLGGDLKATADKALQASHDYVTENLKDDMKRHHKTGRTERSLLEDSKVEWTGNVGSIEVGFDIANGGLPSVFLMYGTPKHAPANQYGKASGTNHGVDADKQLFDDVYGARTKKEVRKIQDEIFAKEIKKIMGG